MDLNLAKILTRVGKPPQPRGYLQKYIKREKLKKKKKIAASEYHLDINARQNMAPRNKQRFAGHISNHRKHLKAGKMLIQLQKAGKCPL